MNLVRNRIGNYLILQIDSERVDSTNYLKLEQVITREIKSGEDKIVLDLSKVKFMDSSGLAGLLPAVKTLPQNGMLLIAGLNTRVQQLFKLTKLDEILEIFPSVNEAIQHAESPTESSS